MSTRSHATLLLLLSACVAGDVTEDPAPAATPPRPAPAPPAGQPAPPADAPDPPPSDPSAPELPPAQGGDAGATDDPLAEADAALPPEEPPPNTPADAPFEEVDGLVAVEAEHYHELDDRGTPRSWYLTTGDELPGITPDPDPSHADGASGGGYLEGLPDTRVTHDDPLKSGESFFNTPGQGPTLRYRVYFNTPGRYYGWARANTTGSEDNGLHLGLDGQWPASARRMQWCGNRGKWAWSSAQRDSGGSSCGVQGTIVLEVPAPGEHTVEFSMREDGFELDKWLLTTDPDFRPEGKGPAERRR